MTKVADRTRNRAGTGGLSDTLEAETSPTEREVGELRAASRRAIEGVLDVLGYPAETAAEFERQAWARDHVWRVAGTR